MGSDEQAAALFSRYRLDDVLRIADPEGSLYRSLGLGRGGVFRVMLAPRIWWRGLVALLRGHRVGRLVGDGFQMPGVFLLRNGRVVQRFIHRTTADRPDYVGIAAGETPAGTER